MNNILLIGKGWLGSRFYLNYNNKYSITCTKRQPKNTNEIKLDINLNIFPTLDLNSFNSIVITIPFGRRSFSNNTLNNFKNLINWLKKYQKQIILISSTGIYPNDNTIFDENTNQENLLSPYVEIENFFKNNLKQITILRLGGLMGDDRKLRKYIDLSSNSLDNYINHIHYKDVCSAIDLVISKEIKSEIINVVAPLHPTKREVLNFYNNITDNVFREKKGKVIDSVFLKMNYNFDFVYPNPIDFN